MDFSKLLMLGAGGYAIYMWLQSRESAPVVLPDQTPGVPTVAPTPAVVAALGSFRDAMISAKNQYGYGSRDTFTIDEWNWFLSSKYSVPGPDPDTIAGYSDRTLKIGIDQYALLVVNKPAGLGALTYVSPREIYGIRELN